MFPATVEVYTVDRSVTPLAAINIGMKARTRVNKTILLNRLCKACKQTYTLVPGMMGYFVSGTRYQVAYSSMGKTEYQNARVCSAR